MDILQARKRAQEEKEKEAAAKVRPEEAAPKVEERASSPSPSPDKSPEPAGVKHRKKKTKAAGKPAPSVVMEEALFDAPEESAPQPEQIKNTRLDDIPIGAKSPEEIELQPHEFHGLPGTQDMPELPEMSEEELSGNIGLGDVPRQPEDASPAHLENVEREIEDEGPVDFPEELTPTPVAQPSPRKPSAQVKPIPEARAPVQAPEEAEEDGDHWRKKLDSGDGETDNVSASDAPLEFLSFMLGEEEYGISLLRISEIIKPRVITEVPRVSPFVLGILTLRGVVIPVFDLAKRLSLGNVSINKLSRIIIVYLGEDKVGLLVDRVRDVVRVLPQDIEPPPPVIAGVDMQFLDGVGRAEGGAGAHIGRTFEGASAGIGPKWAGVQATEEEDQKSDEKAAVKRRRLVILLNLERVASL